MTPKNKKIEITIFLAALMILIAVWAVNGYEDTWLYVTAIIIAIPVSWLYFGNKNKDQ